MNSLRVLAWCFLATTVAAVDIEDALDTFDAALSVAAFNNTLRAHLTGTVDIEGYNFRQPVPGLINSKTNNLCNARLTLFLDGQVGEKVYFFTQSRLDRGFDPGDQGAQIRLDEYALRFSPSQEGEVNFQFGKFATVVGNYVLRHLSWENPFISAPLVYENITANSDKSAPVSVSAFVHRFHATDKYEFNPAIWGPSYASGISLFGRIGRFDYAVELKNAALASRPASWNVTETGFNNPTFNGRFGFRPDEAWNLGISFSDGFYFRQEAERTLPPGHDIDDYREIVFGQDISFALHHLQLWAEIYEVRFEVPHVGNADELAYYVEAKYKFTPQFFGAMRWNQQLFAMLDTNKQPQSDLGRIDIGAGYRFNSYSQVKLQYSFQQETSGSRNNNHLAAAQFTVRF